MQDFESGQIQRATLDTRPPSTVFDGPQIGTVVTATPTTVTVVINSYHPEIGFTAPYPRPALHQVSLTGATPAVHQHDPGLPPAGTTCLLLFIGTGIDRPYVVAFYGWPLT